jgi:DNA modification methylase
VIHWTDDHLTLYGGDCRQVLAELPSESVHCVVTSPPYWGLRDYGHGEQLGLEPTPEAYVENMVAVFREVRRVLRADGTLWLNLGDSYAAQRGGTTMPAETLAGGKGGFTDDGGRVNRDRHDGYSPTRNASAIGLKHKDLVGIPWRVAFALQADGWYLRSDIIWSKPNPMPESVTDRPTKAHEYLFLLTKSPRYYFDADAVREPHVREWDAGNGGTFGPVTAAGGKQRVLGGTKDHKGAYPLPNPAGRNLRSVWTIATEPYPGAHFATFPRKLVEPCVKAGSPADGTVLDPFAGSGTTLLVAQALGRRGIGIDLNPDYLKQALTRNAQTPLGLIG